MKHAFPHAVRGLYLALALLPLATPARAQEDYPSAPASAFPAGAFAGAHVSVLLGYDHTATTIAKDIDSTADWRAKGDGLLFGGGIGYDFALTPHVTLGVDAELTGSTGKSAIDAGAGFDITRVRTGRDLYLGTRLGYALSPATLLYAKAGYTNARIDLIGANSSQLLTDRRDLDGFRLGAGVEQKITGPVFTRLEYRYSHYGSASTAFDGYTPDASSFGLKTEKHQVAASVGFRF